MHLPIPCLGCQGLKRLKLLVGCAALLDLGLATWQIKNIEAAVTGDEGRVLMISIALVRVATTWFIFACASISINRNLKCLNTREQYGQTTD